METSVEQDKGTSDVTESCSLTSNTLSEAHSEHGDTEVAHKPTSLPRLVSRMACWNPNCPLGPEQTIYLVGTAHVSSASCEDVRRVIRAVKPQVVMLELCADRRSLLTMTKREVPTTSEMVSQWYSGKISAFQILYAWMTCSIADSLDVLPGEEFRVAVQEASAVGAKVVLGDRPAWVTVARMWAALSRWQRVRLIWGILFTGLLAPHTKELAELIEGMKESDAMTEALKALGEEYPALLRPLIEERDEFMICMLRQLSGVGTRIVAVVGAGHLAGMRAKWDAEIDLPAICSVPSPPPPVPLLGRWRRALVLSLGGTGVLFAGVVLFRSLHRPSWR